MEQERINQLLGEAESDLLERKGSASDLGVLRQTICAFANDLSGQGRPGYIIVGLDNSGRPTGLTVDDALLTCLSQLRSDGSLTPVPTVSAKQATFQGKDVVVMEVTPSDSPPVRLKGVVWVRVGTTTQRASPQDERILSERSVAGAKTFDQRPCVGASLCDLLVEVFHNEYLSRAVAGDVLAANNRNAEEQLASLRFFDIRRGVPTNAGILLFGMDPLEFLPGAYLQFVRYDGPDPTAAVQQEKAVTGSLVTQLQVLDNLIPIQIHTGRVPDRGLRRASRPDYPLDAVRELVLNGVMHRVYEGTNSPTRINWFSDRIEIVSPGGLFGQVTAMNYQRVNDYRNPTLAEAMKVLGYVEKYGTGIARAQAALAANGNPPAQFVFEPTHVMVTIGAVR